MPRSRDDAPSPRAAPILESPFIVADSVRLPQAAEPGCVRSLFEAIRTWVGSSGAEGEREFYEAARSVLKHALLTLSEEEIQAIGKAFGEVIRKQNYTCYGCAIMPDHVHLLIRKHRHLAETMIGHFQEDSRARVLAKPQPGRGTQHPVWGGPGWKVYLDSREDMVRTVRYIRQNPPKAGRSIQRWPFVTPYDGWLPGQVRMVRQARS